MICATLVLMSATFTLTYIKAGTLGLECRSRVKLGKAPCEHMFSAVHPTTDIAKILRHVRFVPKAVIRLAIIARGTDNREHCEAARSVEAYSAVREPETG